MTVSVRVAPSPTGLLHVGNIRAALFNYLFARSQGGSFLLRIDDTDQVRSTQAYTDAIEQDLTWLGIKWDRYEKQSNRFDRYFSILDQLKASGRVYPCFETQAELDLRRKTQLGRGLPPIYDRASLKLSEADRAALIAQGHKHHWRFKLNDVDTKWDDMVQGHKNFPAGSVSDPVLLREDGVPLYSFCSVIDDIDFNITHVIRGEDHVTNTMAQIQIWEAITNKPAPTFGHYPLIVSADGQEMSKRLGTLSVRSMRDEMKIEAMGILSLLARLGTSNPIVPCLTIDELAKDFAMEKISRTPAKFDLEEMKHLSSKILHHTSYEGVKDRLAKAHIEGIDEALWNAVHTNLITLDDVAFWRDVVKKEISAVSVDKGFCATALAVLPPAPWDLTTWDVWTKALKEKTGLKGKELFMPLRLALTGVDHGPELKTLLPLIGEERVRQRLG